METDRRATLTDKVFVPIGTELLDERQVAHLLNCSQDHVRRMWRSGRMPEPVRLGALVRWSRKRIADWIDEGCPTATDEASARSKAADNAS